MMSRRPGTADEEDGGPGLPQSSSEPPPSYNSIYGQEEDGPDASSASLLNGRDEGATPGGPDTKANDHEARIKNIVAYLHRHDGEDSVAPEEIEMMDVGTDDDLTGSEFSSSRYSTARSRLEPGAGVDTADRQEHDSADASVMRLSRRLSMAEMQEVTLDTVADPTDETTVENGRDETTVENGRDEPKETGMFAYLLGSQTKKLIVAFTALFVLGLVLMVILLPSSFIYVDYYEYALTRNSLTGTVDYSRVYDTGCYLLAPQDELISFKATAHLMSKRLVIMTDTGLSVDISFTLQYFLKRDEVPQLYKKYHHEYDKVMQNLVEAEVKNLAVSFTLVQYRLHRQDVEAAIWKRIHYVLSGDCCDACCPDKCGRRKVDCGNPSCHPIESCHRGHHVDVRHFQFREIDIPSEVENKFMRRIILQIEADTEMSLQQKAVEVKITEKKAQNIRNQAEEIRQKAWSQARAIRIKAEADKLMVVEKARQKALQQVFSHFNMTSEETRLSFIYSRMLHEKQDNLRYTYAYERLGVMSP